MFPYGFFAGRASAPMDPLTTPPGKFIEAASHIPNDWTESELAALRAVDRSKGEAGLYRLSRLIAIEWATETRKSGPTRPEVLAIVCGFLANPDEPHTFDVARFAVTAALRRHYGISYTAESLVAFKQSYERVRQHFGNARLPLPFREMATEDCLLVDILCMNRFFRRSLSPQCFEEFYQSYEYPFGIRPDNPARGRGAGNDPVLALDIPDFSTIINLTFTQPSGIPGLDDITGGLLGPIVEAEKIASGRPRLSGGLVTLVAGPPGSGKTTICLTIAARMAEMGADVRYVTVEETRPTLRGKLELVPRLSDWLLPQGGMQEERLVGEVAPRLSILELGEQFRTLRDIVAHLEKDFRTLDTAALFASQSERFRLRMVFPRVVVVDSLTALLEVLRTNEVRQGRGSEDNVGVRRELSAQLNRLRDLGVCVFLIGSSRDHEDESLAYLVDNVFLLGFDAHESVRHPVRFLDLEKTRLQASSRGRHVLHLAGSAGCSVRPGLHSVLERLSRQPALPPDPNAGATFGIFAAQMDLPFEDLQPIAHIKIRSRAHTLVYGHGSTGKARFALALATAERKAFSVQSDQGGATAPGDDKQQAATPTAARVLIVSFLYDRQYYDEMSRQLADHRARAGGLDNSPLEVVVLSFYPGMITPESVVAAVDDALRSAELSGSPFSSAIVDGVHNIMMQFPLLDHEPLLWPALYRLLRTKGLDTVTTFTFFEMTHDKEEPANRFRRGVRMAMPQGSAGYGALAGSRLAVSQELYYHLLVSSCDYTFRVERSGPSGIKVSLITDVDPTSHRGEFGWDPTSFRMSLLPDDGA